MLLPRFPIRALLFAGLAVSAAFAQVKPTEVPGGKDYPMISRYEGSVLQDVAQESFAQIRVPASPGRLSSTGLVFDKSHTVEGHVGYEGNIRRARSQNRCHQVDRNARGSGVWLQCAAAGRGRGVRQFGRAGQVHRGLRRSLDARDESGSLRSGVNLDAQRPEAI